MRTFIAAVAATFAVAIPSVIPIRDAHAQPPIVVMEDAAPAAAGPGVHDDALAPPWHGNVAPPGCEPCCRRCGVFHANPCGQLCMRSHLHHGCATLPPLFPRLHAWWTEGLLPTPRPLALPRCHQCGAVLEGGL